MTYSASRLLKPGSSAPFSSVVPFSNATEYALRGLDGPIPTNEPPGGAELLEYQEYGKATLVRDGKLSTFWPGAALILARVQAKRNTSDTIEAIHADLIANKAQLWLSPDRETALVTGIDSRTAPPELRFRCVAGTLADCVAYMPQVLRWGHDHGCRGWYMEGRPGWAPMLRKLFGGYVERIVMKGPIHA